MPFLPRQVVLPYLKHKADVRFDQEREAELMESAEQRAAHSPLRTWLRRWYPTLHAAWDVLAMGYIIAFALQYTR